METKKWSELFPKDPEVRKAQKRAEDEATRNGPIEDAHEEAIRMHRRMRYFPELPASLNVHSVKLLPGGQLGVTAYTARAEEHEEFVIEPTSAVLWRRLLHESFELAPAVTLRDLLLLLDRLDHDVRREVELRLDIYGWDIDLRDWTDALRVPTPPAKDEPLDEQIEYLEVYNGAELGKYGAEEPTLNMWYDFHGIGYAVPEDVDAEEYEKRWQFPPTIGYRMPWALEFSTPEAFLDHPLRYDPKVEVWAMGGKDLPKEPVLTATRGITLKDFIWAVLSELGRHRKPDDPPTVLEQELLESVAEAARGEGIEIIMDGDE